jgi:hypothetical protein
LIHLLYFILAQPFLTWLCFSLVPTGNFNLFLLIYIILNIVSLGLFYMLIRVEKQNLVFHKRSFILALLFIILLIVQYKIYLDRWSVEPHGMDDAKVLWNAKAYSIYLDFSNSEKVQFNREGWKLGTYPTGLPLMISSIGVLLGKWSISIPYVMSYILSFLFLLGIFRFVSAFEYNWKKLLIYIGIVFVWICNPHYLFLQSDICADYPIAFGFFAFGISLSFSPKRESIILAALSLAWSASLKDEGILFLPIGILLYLFLLYKNKNDYKDFLLFITIIFLFLYPQILHKANTSLLSYAFQESGQSLGDRVLSRIFNLDYHRLLLGYAYKFHIEKLFGLGILITLFLLSVRRTGIHYYYLAFYWLMNLGYYFLYTTTTIDLLEHVETSYDRIVVPLYSFLFLSILSYWRESNLTHEEY